MCIRDRPLDEVRNEYLRDGFAPKLIMKSFIDIKTLRIKRDLVIHRVTPYHCNNAEFLWEVNRELKEREKPPIPYRGEGLPNVTFRTLLRLLKPARLPTSRETRLNLLETQNNKCAKCGREDSLEADHIHPISKDPSGWNDNEEELELLCQACGGRE